MDAGRNSEEIGGMVVVKTTLDEDEDAEEFWIFAEFLDDG